MTEKELHKLKRPDLLALLVSQGRQAADQQTALQQAHEAIKLAGQLEQRLKDRLNDKDAQLARLKEKLNDKDAQIDELNLRLDGKDAQRQQLILRLDEKDAQLDKLKRCLDEKDATIAALRKEMEEYTSGRFLNMENGPSLDEIAQRVELVLHAAQKAAGQYMRMAQQ